jgi:hypothetical protein
VITKEEREVEIGAKNTLIHLWLYEIGAKEAMCISLKVPVF